MLLIFNAPWKTKNGKELDRCFTCCKMGHKFNDSCLERRQKQGGKVRRQEVYADWEVPNPNQILMPETDTVTRLVSLRHVFDTIAMAIVGRMPGGSFKPEYWDPSVTEKGASCLMILECMRFLISRFDRAVKGYLEDMTEEQIDQF